MDAIINKETLEQILDQALQDVTEQTAGVRLHQGDKPPGENLCTVHITFDRGFDTGLTLYADTNLLVRMAQNSFHEETVTQEDLEEFSKEYFNVLCGKIAGALYRETRVAAHFSQPTFYHGRYIPEGREAQFVLTYSDENSEGAQLIHHIPSKAGIDENGQKGGSTSD